MFPDDAFAGLISRKHILFDTCVIIRAFEDFSSFKKILEFLEQEHCVPVIFSFIEFEFIRGAYDIEHRKKRKEFLELLAPTTIPLDEKQIMADAIAIANTYAARKIHSPSIVDCAIAAYLKKYHGSLFFVTLNHKDFPTFLFDRVQVYPVDTEKDVFSLGFYRYNITKGERLGLM